MKLKTKFQDEDFELGEVVDVTISTTSLVDTHIKLKAKSKRGGEHMFNFSRISELFDLFEDYEEPKEYWYIEPNGVVARIDEWDCCTDSDIEIMKALGNYFETREEAEKAVEKLKAWKRLEDKGFRLNHWKEAQLRPNMSCVAITGNMKLDEEAKADLNLLFGGEE